MTLEEFVQDLKYYSSVASQGWVIRNRAAIRNRCGDCSITFVLWSLKGKHFSPAFWTDAGAELGLSSYDIGTIMIAADQEIKLDDRGALLRQQMIEATGAIYT